MDSTNMDCHIVFDIMLIGLLYFSCTLLHVGINCFIAHHDKLHFKNIAMYYYETLTAISLVLSLSIQENGSCILLSNSNSCKEVVRFPL